MALQNNTFLITGGSSGIGLELAKRVSEKNKVLICGRSVEKLEQAKTQLPEIEYFQCDISKPEECEQLFNWVSANHPSCNILVNNAAIVHMQSFRGDQQIIEKANAEIQTNLMAPIMLISHFLPLLEKNDHSKIINVTTGLVYVPRAAYPFYNATKAGLHSFTQVLRSQLTESPVEIMEVLFPAVDTPWHKGNPPKIAISVQKAVEGMLKGIEKGQPETRVGGVKLLYWLSRIAPAFAFKKLNSLSGR